MPKCQGIPFSKQARNLSLSLSDRNWTRTQNHLVRKRTLNHLVYELSSSEFESSCSYSKYKFLIENCKNVGIKYLNNPNGFIECSNMMDDVYEKTNEYNPIRKRKKLIVFDKMIADIMTNRRFQA